MEINLNRPDKSCWQFSAHENNQKLGSVIFFPKGKKNIHIGYIGLTNLGREYKTNPSIGQQLLEACIVFGVDQGFESISGSLVPVPGCEHAILDLLTHLNFNIDKFGNISRLLTK